MVLPIRLDARVDTRVADYRVVADAELVRQKGLFVAEGRLVVRRLLDDRRYVVRSLLLSEAAFRALAPSLEHLDADIFVYISSPPALSELVGYNVHRGCLALAERPQAQPFAALLEQARVVVVVESVADPSNLGGIFRNALAFGAASVLLSPTCCDPLYRKAVRTSMAATIRVPFARVDPWPEGLADIRSAGFTLVAMTPQPPAVTLEAFVAAGPHDRIALMVGAEGEGLSAHAAALADVRVRIPVGPDVDSVNVSVAAGIALYRMTTS